MKNNTEIPNKILDIDYFTQKTEFYNVTENDHYYATFDYLCSDTAGVRNLGLFYMLEVYNKNKEIYNENKSDVENMKKLQEKYPTWTELDKLARNSNPYKNLPAKVAQNVIKSLLKEWKSYWENLISFWKWFKSPNRKPGLWNAKPNPPGYKGTKEKGYADGRYVANINSQNIKGSRGKKASAFTMAPNGILVVCEKHENYRLEIPFNLHNEILKNPLTGKPLIKKICKNGKIVYQKRDIKITEVRIVPRPGYYKVEVVFQEGIKCKINIEETPLSKFLQKHIDTLSNKISKSIAARETNKNSPLPFYGYASIDLGMVNIAALAIQGINYPLIWSGDKIIHELHFYREKVQEEKERIRKSKGDKWAAKQDKIVKTINEIQALKNDINILSLEGNSNSKMLKDLDRLEKRLLKLKPELGNPEYNPEMSTCNTITTEKEYSSKTLRSIYRKINLKLEHYLHIISKGIVDACVATHVHTLIIGRNEGWKQGSHYLNFNSFPHHRLIKLIQYKAEKYNITVETTEESHTSKANPLTQDKIPSLRESRKARPSFSGKRVQRDIYLCKDGTEINSDVVGSVNIQRKVVDLSSTEAQKWVKGVCSTPFSRIRLDCNIKPLLLVTYSEKTRQNKTNDSQRYG